MLSLFTMGGKQRELRKSRVFCEKRPWEAAAEEPAGALAGSGGSAGPLQVAKALGSGDRLWPREQRASRSTPRRHNTISLATDRPTPALLWRKPTISMYGPGARDRVGGTWGRGFARPRNEEPKFDNGLILSAAAATDCRREALQLSVSRARLRSRANIVVGGIMWPVSLKRFRRLVHSSR